MRRLGTWSCEASKLPFQSPFAPFCKVSRAKGFQTSNLRTEASDKGPFRWVGNKIAAPFCLAEANPPERKFQFSIGSRGCNIYMVAPSSCSASPTSCGDPGLIPVAQAPLHVCILPLVRRVPSVGVGFELESLLPQMLAFVVFSWGVLKLPLTFPCKLIPVDCDLSSVGAVVVESK